ncbi:MAG: SUMF1/EgtB/PvdO family nonheme iron enzyme, partial [Acidobacteriota bacterium]|nr:SUMF1/EgtB/PvdO family nonheme iron enzyme [Acidobacteriota bacterium]
QEASGFEKTEELSSAAKSVLIRQGVTDFEKTEEMSSTAKSALIRQEASGFEKTEELSSAAKSALAEQQVSGFEKTEELSSAAKSALAEQQASGFEKTEELSSAAKSTLAEQQASGFEKTSEMLKFDFDAASKVKDGDRQSFQKVAQQSLEQEHFDPLKTLPQEAKKISALPQEDPVGTALPSLPSVSEVEKASRSKADTTLIIAAAAVVMLGFFVTAGIVVYKVVLPRVFPEKKPVSLPISPEEQQPTSIDTAKTDKSDQTPQPPLPLVPEGMVLIPGGEYTIGSDVGDEFSQPAHKVKVEAFYIDMTEVTKEQYAAFIKATGRRAPKDWPEGQPPGNPKEPVTGVSFADAEAYAKWVGKRLPSEQEWEIAAAGAAHKLYPWGNEWLDGRANTSEQGKNSTVEVGLFKGGKSDFGVYDMCGNVWEWTSSIPKPYPGLKTNTAMVEGDPRKYRVIRGGSFMEKKDYSSTVYRNWVMVNETNDALGFRCAKDAE